MGRFKSQTRKPRRWGTQIRVSDLCADTIVKAARMEGLNAAAFANDKEGSRERGRQVIDLKQLAGRRYRVMLEESAQIDTCRENRVWYYQIPCKLGHIGVWGENTLSAYTDRPRRYMQLELVPGAKVIQRGDRELTVTFDPSMLDVVAESLGAKKRRVLTEEQKARLREVGFASRFLHGTESVENALETIEEGEDGLEDVLGASEAS